MLKGRILKLALAAVTIASAIALTSLGATAASAATVAHRATTAAVPVAHQQDRLMQQSPQVTHYVTLVNYNGRSWSYPCEEGTTFHGGVLPNSIYYVINGCAVRVWLHQNNNNSGANICTSPNTAAKTNSSKVMVNVYVSNNGSNC